MTIPSHRAAAEVPTPAHSFELRDGELVNLTEEARKAAETPPPAAKPRRPASEVPVVTAPMAD
jgi:hypothetical protein